MAVHGRTDGEAAYVAGSLGYAYHAITTDRHVTIAGDDHFRGEFAAQSITAELEAGYKMEWLTPYAAIRGHAYAAPAYSETTVSGNSTYALSYAAQTMLTARTELGVRMDWTTIVGDNAELSVHTGAAWAHDFRSGAETTSWFQALGPTSSFTISGATPTLDSLLLTAGAEIDFGTGFGLSGELEGQVTQNAVALGGSITLSHNW